MFLVLSKSEFCARFSFDASILCYLFPTCFIMLSLIGSILCSWRWFPVAAQTITDDMTTETSSQEQNISDSILHFPIKSALRKAPRSRHSRNTAFTITQNQPHSKPNQAPNTEKPPQTSHRPTATRFSRRQHVGDAEEHTDLTQFSGSDG